MELEQDLIKENKNEFKKKKPRHPIKKVNRTKLLNKSRCTRCMNKDKEDAWGHKMFLNISSAPILTLCVNVVLAKRFFIFPCSLPHKQDLCCKSDLITKCKLVLTEILWMEKMFGS